MAQSHEHISTVSLVGGSGDRDATRVDARRAFCQRSLKSELHALVFVRCFVSAGRIGQIPRRLEEVPLSPRGHEYSSGQPGQCHDGAIHLRRRHRRAPWDRDGDLVLIVDRKRIELEESGRRRAEDGDLSMPISPCHSVPTSTAPS
jgi:hypothetical protein